MTSSEKVLEILNKLDEEKITAEYAKEKEKEQDPISNENTFNKITYIKYDILNARNQEIDFLFDYSKILGPEHNDIKLNQWQMLNKDRLFPYGIDISVLSQRINGLESKGATNKMDNIISSLNYRMQRHGRLAPTKDIARKLQKKTNDDQQMPLAEEDDEDKEIDIEHEETIEDKNKEKSVANNISTSFYNGLEENFYDINDPFIDDNLDEKSEGENNKLLFKLSLPPGNYTENEILQNLKKNFKGARKLKTFKKIKKKNKTQASSISDNNYNDSNNDKGINDNNDINDNSSFIKYNIQSQTPDKLILEKTLLSKKTRREASFNSHNRNHSHNSCNSYNSENNEKIKKKKKTEKIQLTDTSMDNVYALFKQILSSYSLSIETDRDKETFIRKNIKNIIEIYTKSPLNLCKIIQKELKMELDVANMLVEYEIFKFKMENYYTNFSKFLAKLIMALKNNGIPKISNYTELLKYSNSVSEIDKSLMHVLDNIYNYSECFNEYIGKHYNDLFDINNKLSRYIRDIKERNNGLILKLSCKFDEYEQIIARDAILKILLQKYTDLECILGKFDNDKNKRYSILVFFDKKKGNEIKIYKDPFENENKENKYEVNNNKNRSKKYEIKTTNLSNNANNTVGKPNIVKSYDVEEKDIGTFDNLSCQNEISTSISSPLKTIVKNSNKNVSYIISFKNKKNYNEKK